MVKEEVAGNSMAYVRIQTALESRKLVVEIPEKMFLEKVKFLANFTGDAHILSETDLQLLALALQLKTQGYRPLIATDDYSIQNIARHLGIEFASLATFGIRIPLKWVRYCPACRRKYPSDFKSKRCHVCGTELKRKPLKKLDENTKGMEG